MPTYCMFAYAFHCKLVLLASEVVHCVVICLLFICAHCYLGNVTDEGASIMSVLKPLDLIIIKCVVSLLLSQVIYLEFYH